MAKKKTVKKKPVMIDSSVKRTGWLQVGKTWFNLDEFAKVTEEEAIEKNSEIEKGRIRNVWKHANGKR